MVRPDLRRVDGVRRPGDRVQPLAADRRPAIQKAADAAALGGAVFMPENVGNRAYLTAEDLSSENGFTNGSDGVTVTTAPGELPNQLKVTISVQHQEPVGCARRLQQHDHRAQGGGRVPTAPEPREPAELVRQRPRVRCWRSRNSGATSSVRRRARTRATRSSRWAAAAARRCATSTTATVRQWHPSPQEGLRPGGVLLRHRRAGGLDRRAQRAGVRPRVRACR